MLVFLRNLCRLVQHIHFIPDNLTPMVEIYNQTRLPTGQASSPEEYYFVVNLQKIESHAERSSNSPFRIAVTLVSCQYYSRVEFEDTCPSTGNIFFVLLRMPSHRSLPSRPPRVRGGPERLLRALNFCTPVFIRVDADAVPTHG